MEVKRCTQETLKWDFEGCGLFETTIWDGKITDLRFHRTGSESGEMLWALEGSENFLKCVYKALGETLDYIETKKETDK